MAELKSIADILGDAQRVGTLGDRPIPEVIAHASRFLGAMPAGSLNVIDIGTGAGVPGLILLAERPDIRVTLVDRRATRMDALRRGVMAAGLASRATVLTADIRELAKMTEHQLSYDVVVSRGFGPPDTTATLARPLLREGGLLLVSEPPDSDPNRWNLETLSRIGFAAPVVTDGIASLRAIPAPRAA